MIWLGWGAVFGLFQRLSFYFQQKYQAVVCRKEGDILTTIPMESHIFRFSAGSTVDVRTGTVLKNRATQACTSLQIINYNFFSRYKSSVCIPLFLSLPSPALLLYIRLLSRISPQSLAALSKHNRAKSRHETWIRSSVPAVFSAQIPSCSQHRILLSCSKPLGAGSFSINTHSSTYLFKVIILNWSTEDINL